MRAVVCSVVALRNQQSQTFRALSALMRRKQTCTLRAIDKCSLYFLLVVDKVRARFWNCCLIFADCLTTIFVAQPELTRNFAARALEVHVMLLQLGYSSARTYSNVMLMLQHCNNCKYAHEKSLYCPNRVTRCTFHNT